MAAAVLGLVASGCGGNVGWVLKPVPLEEKLAETTVGGEEGLFVADKILLLDVDGELRNERGDDLLGLKENPVGLFVEKLDKAEADENVKAVVLRINSPGGGVTASDIMYQRLLRFRQSRGVPVVAIIEDTGASGGYYLACAADVIMAHPTSVTGSIGVVVQTISFAGTMEKLGIEAEAVASGPRKTVANPLKPLDKEDLALLQRVVDIYHERFVKVVTAGRPALKADDVRKLADGRIYTGEQAKANGLVDAVGYLGDAVALARRQSGVTKGKVVMYHRPWGAPATAYSAAPGVPAQFNLFNVTLPSLLSLSRPRFMYLWTGRR
jgi:protease-4